MTGPRRLAADRLLTAKQAAAFIGETLTRFTHSPAYQDIPVTPRRASPGARPILMYRVAELEAWLDAHGPVEP